MHIKNRKYKRLKRPKKTRQVSQLRRPRKRKEKELRGHTE